MKTITIQNEPDLDHRNRFFRDNLMAMTETKLLMTAKQEAENRLVIGKYNQAVEIAKITGNKVDPKLENAYLEIIRERTDKESKLH